jgi:hypothetical protein
MALIWFEGFDYLPTATTPVALLASLGFYDLQNCEIVSPGRFGGQAIQTFLGVSPGDFTRALTSHYTTAQLGGARIGVGGGGDRVNFVDLTTGTTQCYVIFGDYGIVSAWKGDGTFLGATGGNAYVSAAWAYYEFGVTIGAGGNGALEVRVNAVPVLQLVNVDTQVSANAWFNGITVSAAPVTWDDFYMTDATGPAPWNGFLGNVRVRVLQPNGAGAHTAWTASGSLPNWESVLNLNVDDSLYVYDDETGDYDLYQLTPVLPDVPIFGAQIKLAARQDDATQRFLKSRLLSGSATAYGGSYALNQNYAYQTDVFQVDPNTGSPWTALALNSAQIGPQVAG